MNGWILAGIIIISILICFGGIIFLMSPGIPFCKSDAQDGDLCFLHSERMAYILICLGLVIFVAGMYFSFTEKFKNENKKKEKFVNKYNLL